MRTLREFGFGKDSLNDIVMHDVLQVVETFENQLGTPVDVGSCLNIATISVLARLVAGWCYLPGGPKKSFFPAVG